MNKQINNKEELKYTMQFYGIKKIPVFENGNRKGWNLGELNDKMEYIPNRHGRYLKPEYSFLAISYAIAYLNEDIEKLAQWRDVAKRTFTTKIISWDYDPSTRNKTTSIVKSWLWKSDMTDSGLLVQNASDNSGVELRGNINQMRKYKSYANNHYRYCGGGIYFADQELEDWLSVFENYGLFESYNSFEEYYHNAIVD